MKEASALESLIARQAIVDVIHRYVRGGDRLDVELFKSCFWEDGGYYQLLDSPPMHQMAESLLNGLMRQTFSITHHMVSNIRVEFVDLDRANTETYFRAFHLTRPELGKEKLEAVIGARRLSELGGDWRRPYEVIVGGRYLDNFERRAGEWRIKHRRLLYDWTTIAPATGLRRDEGLIATSKLEAWGSRDRSDPSYSYDS